jgi:hypothetical protein
MAEIKKFFCVKDFLVDTYYLKGKHTGNSSYGFLCKKGNICDILVQKEYFMPYVDVDTGYLFTNSEFNEHFITLEKFREQQINKILKNE